MVKIKSLKISGLRGVRQTLDISLQSKSALIYGDNGAGKSSITDSVEWFYKDGVEHLSNEEISRGGKSALRNVFLSTDENAQIAITYTKTELDDTKSIDGNQKVTNLNTKPEFARYAEKSSTENLILRYKDLIKFIVATKTEKLNSLQEIIGFGEVKDTRSLLKTTATRISRNIKGGAFSDKKSAQQSILLESIEQNITSSQQFFSKASELVSSLGVDKTLKTFEDVKDALKSIETSEETKAAEEVAFFNKVFDTLETLHSELLTIHKGFDVYHKSYSELGKNVEKVSNLQLLSMLTEGIKVLESELYEKEECPLCEQTVDKVKLLKNLKERIESLEETKQEYDKLQTDAEILKNSLRNLFISLQTLLKEKHFSEDVNETLKTSIGRVKDEILRLGTDLKKKILSKETLQDYELLLVDLNSIITVKDEVKLKVDALNESLKGSKKLQVHTNLARAHDAYIAYKKVEQEEKILTKQLDTINVMYSEFVKKQEEALDSFIKAFSGDINTFYVEMNPDEHVENISLVPLKDKSDELSGITIEYEFYSTKVSPPTALLSESHINCLGLAFFLASVKAFNKENNFVILDDVISSFDRAHRTRFIRLLINRFSDYQIILLTHEKEFFEIAASEAKAKGGWLIKSLSWTAEEGTLIEEPIVGLKNKIDVKLKKKIIDGLGNDIRKYAERQCKQIAFNIEANFAFRFNNANEARMLNELLSGIQNRITGKSPTDLKPKNIILPLLGSPMLIGNKASHDNEFNEDIGDLVVFNSDVDLLVNTFYCSAEGCNSYVSIKNYDIVGNKIRCKCGTLSYEWKE